MRSILWYLKQLLPLTYRTHYGKDGKEMFCVWRMWFGKCFDVEEYAVGTYEGPDCVFSKGSQQEA